MRTLWTIAIKDLRILLRQKADAFFIFVFPVLYATFFTLVVSGGGSGGIEPLKIMVVDEDGTAASAQFVEQLQASGGLSVELAEREAAMTAVRKGQRVAYVLIEDGFGRTQEFIFAGESPEITLGIDPSRQAEAGLLQGLLNQAGAQLMQSAFRDGEQLRKQVAASRRQLALPTTDLPADQKSALLELLDSLDRLSEANDAPQTAPGETGGETGSTTGGGFGPSFQPLRVKLAGEQKEQSARRNPATVTLPQGLVWGLLACAAAFGTSLISERTRGTLVRLRTSPISPAHILAGKGLACFITLVGVSVLMLLLGRLAFGVVPQSLPLLALAVLASGICVVGLMMLIAVLGKTEAGANGIGWAIMLVMAMFGGAMIPTFMMPGWMQSLSYASPVKWAILSLEGALWRGYSPAEMLLPCGVLVAIGVALFAAGATLFRWHSD